MSVPPSARRRPRALLTLLLALGLVATTGASSVLAGAAPVPGTDVAATVQAGLPPGGTKAGVASVDASWHLGASGGQFSAHEAPPGNGEYVDPFLHAKRKRPTQGLQSRIVTRAMVVEGANRERVAIVANDLYLPNDLLNRRVAQLLQAA